MIPDPKKFPNGIKGVADKVHALGLKLGIYSSAGNVSTEEGNAPHRMQTEAEKECQKTCGGYPASLGFEEIDAEAWAEWGVDCTYIQTNLHSHSLHPSVYTDE
jgi:alpha-galactosidase